MIGHPPSGSGWSMPSHISRVPPLRPAWPSCRQIFAGPWAWAKPTMRVQAASCASFHRPVQPGVMRASARWTGHFGVDQAGAAGRAGAVMDQVPVGRQAVLGAVLAHRGDDDAVGQRHAAQAERLEHRRPFGVGGFGVAGGLAGEQGVHLAHEGGRAQREVVVGDRLRPRHHAEREAGRVHRPEAADMLEPHQRDVGGVLDFLHRLPPAAFEAGQAFGDGAAGHDRGVQRDRVLHRQLGAGADGEMRGRLGVAQQHDVSPGPAGAADHRELPPLAAVGDQPVAGEFLGEDGFHEAGGLGLGGVVQAGAVEGFGLGFQHPGAGAAFVLVAVGDEDALRPFLEEEGEGVERPGAAHPGEAVRPQVGVGLEMRLIAAADGAVDAVGGDDQVGVGEIVRRGLLVEQQFDAERAGAVVQQHQQRPAGAAAEPVAADAVDGAADVDLDVVPVGEIVRDRAIAGRVGGGERVQRLVAEHHAEAERVVRAVALDHRDVRVRTVPLQQDGEIQARRAAADHRNAHAHLVPTWG